MIQRSLTVDRGSRRLVLTRYSAKIELSVDGETCISWTDDGKTGGPALGGGKIGLRQQNDLRGGITGSCGCMHCGSDQ